MLNEILFPVAIRIVGFFYVELKKTKADNIKADIDTTRDTISSVILKRSFLSFFSKFS